MSGRHARVLIVDDSPEDLATYTRWLLACDERSLTVFTASSLESALDMCRTCRPECIVLDYDLRETTGLEVMAELRRHGFDTPIIAITGNGSEAIAVEFMKAGARDYLTKTGVTAHELCSAVVALLSPHTVRQQLTLYRQRERTINAELALALERVSFLAETGKLLAATLDYREVIGLALTRAMPFLAQACIVDILEEGMIQRHDAYVDDWAAKGTTNQLRMRLPTAEGASFPVRTIRAGMPLYFAHAALIEAARDDVDLRVLLERGLVAAAFLPLRCTGPALGVLTLLSTRPDAFTGMERALCEDYAQRVAVALANVRIVEAERVARERAEAARRRLTFQSRISSLFAQSLDWENALQKLMKLVTAAFCDTAAIFTIAESSRSLGLRAVASVNADLETAITAYFSAVEPLATDDTSIGRALRTGRAQFFETDLVPVRADVLKRGRHELIDAWAPVSVITVPLEIHGVALGAVTFVRDVSAKHFGIDDVTVAEDLARRTAIYMENARLYEREHGIAHALQQALLPTELPFTSDLLFGMRYFPGAEGMDVGGDWYDIVEDGRHMVITIGDVVGRGLKAAVSMGQYRDILRAYAFDGYGPAAALTRLNDFVHALRGEAFATCIIIILDRQARTMRYASAGHPPAMLRLADGSVHVLAGASSMPIGAWPRTEYLERSIPMPIGSTLVLYTDGLVETRNRSASQGVEVLCAALARSSPDIELMLDGVLREVAPDRSDDVAVLAIEMLPLQSATLKRWVARRMDPVTMRMIQAEFDAVLERDAAPDADCFGARLILGELLSNVVRHAPGAFRLELDWSAEYAELRLFDTGPGLGAGQTAITLPDMLSTSGRGLFVISSISRGVVMTPRASGGLATSVVLPVRHRSAERELAVR